MSDMLRTGTLKGERAIGYNLNQIMRNNGVTLEQLANLTQISIIHIQAILTGSILVEDHELDLIADKLGVDKIELLQPVSDDKLQHYNIHYMGEATCDRDMDEIRDKVDMYVRLLNMQSDK